MRWALILAVLGCFAAGMAPGAARAWCGCSSGIVGPGDMAADPRRQGESFGDAAARAQREIMRDYGADQDRDDDGGRAARRRR